MQVFKNREQLEIFLANNVLMLSKEIGEINESIADSQMKLEGYNDVQESIATIFDSIKNIINENEELAEYLLSGDFRSVLMHQTPLFVMLDYLYCLSSNLPIILSEKEKQNYESLIDYARELKFEAKVNKNWHVSEQVVKNLYTGDVTCNVVNIGSECVYFKKKTKDGKIITDSYNSTISSYKFLYPHKVEDIEDYQFNYDYAKYPELVTDDLWLAVITNRTYEWGTWRLNAHDRSILFFKEQEKVLENKYQKLCEYKMILDFEKKKKLILDTLTYYLVDKSLQEFVVDTNIPCDEELFKEVNSYLELIYIEFVKYLKYNNDKSFKEAIEDEMFIKEIMGYVYSIDTLNYRIKKYIVQKIADYYAKKKNISNSSNLSFKLEKLPLDTLLEYNKKLNSNFLKQMELNRILKQML